MVASVIANLSYTNAIVIIVIRTAYVFYLCILCSLACLISAEDQPWRKTGFINHPDIQEISGIVPAHTFDGFWVHNDSGDDACIYAIDPQGSLLATFRVEDVEARDWEDMAAVKIDGLRYLVCGDIGDNFGIRTHVQAVMIPEPRLPESSRPEHPSTESIQAARQVKYRYPGGARDAEGLAIDAESGEILILSKRALPPVLYAGPLNPEDSNAIHPLRVVGPMTLPAPTIADLKIRGAWAGVAHMPTAMDLRSDGLALAVSTYVDVWVFIREPGQTWAATISTKDPIKVATPVPKQSEAVCFSRDSQAVILTSEQLPAPLIWSPIPNLDQR